MKSCIDFSDRSVGRIRGGVVGCGEKRQDRGLGSSHLKRIDRRTEKLLREIRETLSLQILFYHQHPFYSEIPVCYVSLP